MGERRVKITAAYDSDGRILAAIIDEGYEGPRPVPGEGIQVGTFDVGTSDVSADVNSLSLEEICTTFRIDPESQGLVRR